MRPLPLFGTRRLRYADSVPDPVATWRRWSWGLRVFVALVCAGTAYWAGMLAWLFIAFSRNPIAH